MPKTEPSSPAAAPRRFRWRRLFQYRLRTLILMCRVKALRQRFQFSIRSLLLLTLLCAVGTYVWKWYTTPIHQNIRRILLSDKTDTEKLSALSPYVRIGETHDIVKNRLGEDCDCDGHGPGFFFTSYFDSGLVVYYDADSVSYAIGSTFQRNDGSSSLLLAEPTAVE